MHSVTRRTLLASLGGAVIVPALNGAGEDWVSLFDGKSLSGWTAAENRNSWKVVDGMLAADGPRSHLFYSGPVRSADFKNFELKAEILTRPLCNSGVFFHSRFQETGWPEQGFEVQVANTATGEGSYIERKKTGSLYGVRNVYKQLLPDNEWFEMHVTVRGKQVQVRLNGVLVVDYVEPDPPLADPDSRGRIIGRGTFALQCHDAGSKALFRKIAVKPLPNDLPTAGDRPVVDDVYRQIRNLSAHNYPVVDYHTHLKGGWTIEQALRRSRETGIGYGIAVNCGKGFPVQNDASAGDFVESLKGQPVFIAMQAEGREWVEMFSAKAVAKFDYVFSDAMTFTHEGRRRRLWIPEEVGDIGDPERFMDVIVNKIVGILEHEPIDIHANPTFLPDVMAKDYDRLWTAGRMARVIEAAKMNNVAIEINNRYKIPSAAFLKKAKAAGVKFSFGTNNGDPNIGRLEYPLQMVQECGLKWQDIFVPKPDGEKPVQRKGMPKYTA
jgi:hypothetical protein